MEINISPFDQKDLLELLDLASDIKEQNRPEKKSNKWDDTDYWLMRIEQLKQLIKGRNVAPSLYRSTLPEAEPLQEEKNRQRYQKRKLENDIFNGKDWYENDPF